MVKKESSKPPLPRPLGVIGSISGQRSKSGTMSNLEMHGAFEAPDRLPSQDFGLETSPSRARANTDPDAEFLGKEPNPQTTQADDDSILSKTSSVESEDQELKFARAMAVAIQNNPGMSADEIRKLVASQQQPTNSSASPTVLVPNRLAHMFAASSSVEQQQALKDPKKTGRAGMRTIGDSLRERARGKFSELLVSHSGKTSVDDSGRSEGSSQSVAAASVSNSTASIQRVSSSSISIPSKEKERRKSFRSNNKSSIRTPPISPVPSLDRRTSPASSNADNPSVSVSTVTESLAPPDVGAGLLIPSSIKSLPIRLSGIAWKRRGGMGKYSTTSAWERRRIELQGTKLVYYRDADDVEQQPSIGMSRSGDETDGDDMNQMTDGVVVAKRSTWFEQAAANWSNPSDDPTAPRGYLDIAKEEATVHAAFGHSGAPSPFAVSIKVRAETKWKLCFDYHSTQMEWLAALTDVVVQASVDAYNANLLAAADPANQIDAATVFHPPVLQEPPTTDANAASTHRLWMMDKYAVYSHGDVTGSRPSPNAAVSSPPMAAVASASSRAATTSEPKYTFNTSDHDHAAARSTAENSASKSWVLPEKNVIYGACLLNASLFLARASSVGIVGFWYLLVFVNAGGFLCLVQEPDWRSVLSFVRAMPQAVEGTSHVNGEEPVVSSDAMEKPKITSGSAPPKPKFLPVAGTSAIQLKEPKDPPENSKGESFCAWRQVPGSGLSVRSHGYASTKAKVNSPGDLYECIKCDIFEAPCQYPDMALRVKLPDVSFDDGDGPKTWRAPNIFIISVALPTDAPKLRGGGESGGYTVTMYYKMRQDTRDILKRVTADGYDPSSEKVDDPQKSKVNAARLFEDWCRRAPTDPKFQARFKILFDAHNLKEIGMPGWMQKYNGKPFLIKRAGQTGFLYSHPELSCMEFDVSLHPFPYLAKQAIHVMKENYFSKVLVTGGFVIEGRADDELPECVLGAVQLCYPNPAFAVQAGDFFSGKSRCSF